METETKILMVEYDNDDRSQKRFVLDPNQKPNVFVHEGILNIKGRSPSHSSETYSWFFIPIQHIAFWNIMGRE